MERPNRAVGFLHSIEWPKGLPVTYKVHRDHIVLTIPRLDFILLADDDVVKAEEIINSAMKWLNSNGYPTRLAVV